MGKLGGIGCLVLLLVWIVVASLYGYARANGFVEHAPTKIFLVLDSMPGSDPKCRTTRERRETLGHTARRLGWATPGGMCGDNGSGFYTIVHKPAYPCQHRQWWAHQQQWVTGNAYEVLSADALYVKVPLPDTPGSQRRLMLSYHRNSESLDSTSHNDEAPLLGWHMASVPWNPAAKRPACLSRWSFLPGMDWPPEHTTWLWVAFGLAVALQMLACVGHDRYYPLLWVPVYLAFVLLGAGAVPAYAYSRSACEPQAAALAEATVRTDGLLEPFPERELHGPWIADSSVVVSSQAWFLLLLALALRLIWPALRGTHYLFVPHPAEAFVRRRFFRPPEIDTKGFARSLGRINPNAPEFVLRNMERRMHNLVEHLRRGGAGATEGGSS